MDNSNNKILSSENYNDGFTNYLYFLKKISKEEIEYLPKRVLLKEINPILCNEMGMPHIEKKDP